MSPRPRSDRKSSKPQKRIRRKATGRASRSRKASNSRDVLHLDSPLTDPDFASPPPVPHLDYSAIAATNSLGGVQRNMAWFMPIDKSSAHPSAAHNNTSPNGPGSSALAVSETIEPVRTTRLGKGRARKEDKQGDLVWPEHIEAALIEGLRLYHCTSSKDLHPSHTRNFGRNIKVRRFIEQKTGVHRSTRQISSRIQVLRSLWRDTEDFVLVAQPQELRRMGYKVGVRRPTPRAGPSHIPTLTVRRRTRQGYGEEEIQDAPMLVPEDISFPPTSQRDPAHRFELLPPQTDWNQDLEELLLSGGPTSGSHLRSPTLSVLAPDLAPAYDHPISGLSCDQPMVEMDDDFDIDELLLRLTGHEVPAAFPLSDARNDPLSGLNHQLSPSMSFTMHPPPTVASDHSSTYQSTPPFITEIQGSSAGHAAFPSPVLPPSPMPAQGPVLSFASPASFDALAEHFLDDSEHCMLTPTIPYAPTLPGSGYATAEGSPDLGVGPYLHPGAAFDSTTLFDWTTLTGPVLPPQAEPSLITDHDGEAEPYQSERSESFELVSPPSIGAVNGGGGNDHVDAHAWWPEFSGFDTPFSASPTDPQCTLKLEQGQEQEQEQLLVVKLSDATSPQVQIEPLDGHLQIDDDGDMVKAHDEVVCQVAEEIQVQVTGRTPGIPLDDIQPKSTLHANGFASLAPEQNLEPSHPLSPPVIFHDLGPVASQRPSSLSSSFQHPSPQHAAKKCPCPFHVSIPTKKRERKRKAVVVNEDTVHVAYENGNGNGDEETAQKRPVKRRKSESANAKPRTKRTKEPSRKRRGVVSVEETTAVASIGEPIREKMIVTTDENGRLKMLPLRARVKKHDDEVDSSANANPQPSQAQLPLPRLDVLSPPPRPPQAKPMVPRRILPHPNTGHPLVSPSTQPLSGHVQNVSNALSEPRVPVVPTVPVVSTSVLQHETPGSLFAHPHPASQLASSLPVHVPAPAHTALVGSIVAPLPRYAASYNHFENWNLGFTDTELESEAQLLNALPPPIRRHHSQADTLGTGVVETHSQIDVEQCASTQVQCEQQTAPVYSEYSFDRDSTYVSVPVQTPGYHQHKLAPAPALAPLSMESSTSVEIPQSRYYYMGAQQQIHPAMQQTQQMQQAQQTQAFHGSLMYAVPSIEQYQHHQHRYQHQPSFHHSHDPYHGHLHPASYPHQPPETSNCAQISIEPLYLPQYAHDPYMCGYHHTYA